MDATHSLANRPYEIFCGAIRAVVGMSEATINLVGTELLLSLFGARDQHLRQIREALQVDITHRDGTIRVQGLADSVVRATEVLEQLKALAERQGVLSSNDVDAALGNASNHATTIHEPPIATATAGRHVRPRTSGQHAYVNAMRNHMLTFAVGPAGTGKTYLAVALAVEALTTHLIRKICLVRPAVEAGERLGFLPGDLQAKIHPYLRPLLDALNETMDYEQARQRMDLDIIEVAPLAYMRGRTLNDAFIILDEAQNTTVAQMKMFLTRMGTGSRIVVAGDPTQVDLPPNTCSGLSDAISRLQGIKGIATVRLNKADIVRHRLVQEIVQAYDEAER